MAEALQSRDSGHDSLQTSLESIAESLQRHNALWEQQLDQGKQKSKAMVHAVVPTALATAAGVLAIAPHVRAAWLQYVPGVIGLNGLGVLAVGAVVTVVYNAYRADVIRLPHIYGFAIYWSALATMLALQDTSGNAALIGIDILIVLTLLLLGRRVARVTMAEIHWSIIGGLFLLQLAASTIVIAADASTQHWSQGQRVIGSVVYAVGFMVEVSFAAMFFNMPRISQWSTNWLRTRSKRILLVVSNDGRRIRTSVVVTMITLVIIVLAFAGGLLWQLIWSFWAGRPRSWSDATLFAILLLAALLVSKLPSIWAVVAARQWLELSSSKNNEMHLGFGANAPRTAVLANLCGDSLLTLGLGVVLVFAGGGISRIEHVVTGAGVAMVLCGVVGVVKVLSPHRRYLITL